jgi:calcineurin-like phosphoesterase family protein
MATGENILSYETALKVFKQTVESETRLGRVGADITAGLLGLVDQDLIEATSQKVSDALALNQRVWLTSDLHFGHLNIIRYCDRPFHGLADMTEHHVRQLNKISPDDLVVFAGDMILGDHASGVQYIRSTPGRKILVAGNHDFSRSGVCKLNQERDLFVAVVPFLFWNGPLGRMSMVTHYPIVASAHDTTRTILNFHGHLHQKTLPSTAWAKYVNIGWDVAHSLLCL